PRAGLEALAAMAPDLIIADARGDHPCAKLRERLPEARIVAVAEEPGGVDGADAVLHRPLDFHRVTRELRPIVEGRREERSQAHRRVLLVDDDTDVLEVTRKVLEAAGCVVSCIADSSEMLRAPPGHGYDLVLLDVVMPEVDGLQLCYVLRQHYGEDLRICMITAANDPECLKRAARLVRPGAHRPFHARHGRDRGAAEALGRRAQLRVAPVRHHGFGRRIAPRPRAAHRCEWVPDEAAAAKRAARASGGVRRGRRWHASSSSTTTPTSGLSRVSRSSGARTK